MRASGCCWIPTRNGVSGWRFQTQVDLGSRSDTGKPNRSPDIAILPFLRVPQNCPRTYKLMSFDPDGDTVRCRYGNIRNIECSGCNQPSGFVLDQGSCSLYYRNANTDPSVFGFELVVEDFPERPISLSYTDGTQSYKAPLIPMRHKRSQLWWGLYHATSAPTTTEVPTPTPWWWHHNPTPAPTTTEVPKPTPWWWHHNPTPAPTTTEVPKPTPWWWLHRATSATTTTEVPTPTPWWWHHNPTPAPTMTEVPTPWWWLHNPTPAPTTTEVPKPTPWWWHHNPTPAPTTLKCQPHGGGS
ncbi:Integrin beta-like protein A [Dissostichus eleginoides]|uniref:Integrin beta-like protein A n=1 Tax=Dissostichus eleginoides TaxID=100907 RepID=A0AAD9BZI9_DISEL|nr:Integrin beta-like protein A [Dissostichus eleginoides]